MTSARENILAYIATRLQTVSDVTVYRTREAPVSRPEGTVLILKPEEEKVVKIANEVAVRDLIIVITAIVRDPVPDTALDVALQAIQVVIMTDTTLGGRAARCIEQDTRWAFELADVTAAAVEVRYLVKYLTPTGTISLA
jgi:hypothetical protein